MKRICKAFTVAAAVAAAAALAAPAQAEFSYDYLEFRGDMSLTDNTARGAVGDADGRLVGVAFSAGIGDAFYVTGGFSLEDKSFENEIASAREASERSGSTRSKGSCPSASATASRPGKTPTSSAKSCG